MAVVLSALLGTTVHAEVYRWSDPLGNVHFGDAPPSKGQYQRVDLPPDSQDVFETKEQLGERDASALARETRFENCIEAEQALISLVRQRLPGALNARPTDDTLGLHLLSPLPDLRAYWETQSGQRVFSPAVRNGPYETLTRTIDANCDLGTAVEERQLAALNAQIQEFNCKAMRAAYAAGHGADRHRRLLLEKVRNECG
jgi:hypothetical protein